jgi:hypothetical protein
MYVGGFRFGSDFWTYATVARDVASNKITVTRRRETNRVVERFVDNTSIPAITGYGKPGTDFERYQLVGASPKLLRVDGGPSASGASPLSRYLPYRGDTQGPLPMAVAAAHGRAVLEAPEAFYSPFGPDVWASWTYFATDFAAERPETMWMEAAPFAMTTSFDPEVSDAFLSDRCAVPSLAAPQLNYTLGCLVDFGVTAQFDYKFSPAIVASPSGRRAYTFMEDSVAAFWDNTGPIQAERVCLYAINMDQGSLGLSRLNFCIGDSGFTLKPTRLAMSPDGDELIVIDQINNVWVIK